MKHLPQISSRKVLVFTAFAIFGSVVMSCFPVPKAFQKAIGCYNGKYTGLDTLINIHGLYLKMEIDNNRGVTTWRDGKWVHLGIDTSYSDIFFSSDGIVLANFRGAPSVVDYMNKSAAEGGSISAYYEGVYEVIGDVIKVKYIGTGGYSNNTWDGDEVWYRILDKNTIVDFYNKPLVVVWSDRNNKEFKPIRYSGAQPSRFVPIEKLPKIDVWLKDKKWFVCDH